MPSRKRWATPGLACLLVACAERAGDPPEVLVDLVDDLSVATVLHEQHSLDIGTTEARDFLTEGWSWNERGKTGGTYVWSSRTSSKITFFLAHTRQIPLRFRALPYRCQTCDSQSISVIVNGVGVDEVVLESRWTDYAVNLPVQVLKAGLNDLSFHYRWTIQPSEISDSREKRRLAVAWDWIELGDRPDLRPAADRQASTLEIPPGTQIDYYLDAPRSSRLLIDSVQSQGDPAHPLEISILGEDDAEPELAHPTRIGGAVRLPLGRNGGLMRVRFRTLWEPGDNTGMGYLLHRPRIVASASAAAIPPASSSVAQSYSKAFDSPNMIFYVIDTLRADHLESYGYSEARTPNFTRFASESVVFEEAIAQSSWTKPSTASILTGLFPWAHQATRAKDRISGDLLTLPELLNATGYQTAGVVNNPNASDLFGFDQGFEHFVHLKDWLAPARTHHARALEWLDSLQGRDAPFFLYIHVLEPHGPYQPPPEFLPTGEGVVSNPRAGQIKNRQGLARSQRAPTDQELHDLLVLYDAEIAYIDTQFAEFLQSLKERELYDDSLIVLLSDHGEEFYDHGNWDHGQSLYTELVEVPLVIRFPGAQAQGTRVSVPVQQVDLMPTLMDLLALGGGPDLPGRSLLPLIFDSSEGERVRREFTARKIFSHVEYITPTMVSVIAGDWKLVVRRPEALSIKAELYHRPRDPKDDTDVAAEHPLVVGYLLTAIRREMVASARLGEPETVELDEETRERLQALGYLN